MAKSLFFYDLETSGILADSDRVMQFGGQRTDLDLNPIGEPYNLLISLSKDCLPDPAAVLIHGITPQQTILEGLSEAQFMQLFHGEIVVPDTTFVGFNNIRFDDEFIRFLNYRNLYDPYAWSYENGCSRWDILDVVRMTRAVRPEGINWPTDDKGFNTNRLELLTKVNNLEHSNAHDALSDVFATINVARVIKRNQPKLYAYLFKLRLKSEAAKLAGSRRPFVYTSSHYPSTLFHTTVVVKVGEHPDTNCLLVYDLRHDPSPWLEKNARQLADSWRYIPDRSEDNPPLPVKTMRLNRCPALAPLGVIKDLQTQKRLDLNLEMIARNAALLMANQAFAVNLRQAVEILNSEQQQRYQTSSRPVDTRLYDGFYDIKDKLSLNELHKHESAAKIRKMRDLFNDPRLKKLISLYLARNYYTDLTDEERESWDEFVNRKLFKGGEYSRLASYFNKIAQLGRERTDKRSQLLLEDLKLYGESLLPLDG